MADENKIRHLEMIQDIIKRMAHNSFMLKGWTVTLVVGFFALLVKDSSKAYFSAIYIPILVFWVLDSYYLLQERLYRHLYDKVRIKTADTDFSLHIAIETTSNAVETEQWWIELLNHLHLLKIWHRLKELFSCVLSITEFGFYVPLALLSAIIYLVR